MLRRGALLTVFEPDWHAFRVRGERGDEVVAWINNARHPGIGGQLWELLEAAGFDVLDRVEELSVWRSLDVLDRVVGLAVSVEQAVAASRIDRVAADAMARRAARPGGPR